MPRYIDKSALVAEIDKQKIGYNTNGKHSVEYNTAKKILDILDTIEVKDDYLEKFKSLQHISGDLESTLHYLGYAPNLYYFDESWHVDWISYEGGDSIKDFMADTAEEAINEAYNWFHSTFCND